MSELEQSQKSSEFRSDFKLIVIGRSGTGKTSFIHKWVDGSFTETVKATIVSQFKFKIIENEGRKYRIQIWDIAGQDKNIIVTKIFAKGTHGVIVMSDATNKESLPDSEKFVDGGVVPCVLVENKIDLLDSNEAQNEAPLKDYANKNGFDGAFKASAKSGYNVNESIDFLIKKIIQRLENYENNNQGKVVFSTEKKGVKIENEIQKQHKERKREGNDNCC